MSLQTLPDLAISSYAILDLCNFKLVITSTIFKIKCGLKAQ